MNVTFAMLDSHRAIVLRLTELFILVINLCISANYAQLLVEGKLTYVSMFKNFIQVKDPCIVKCAGKVFLTG